MTDKSAAASHRTDDFQLRIVALEYVFDNGQSEPRATGVP
jgi:hypothetical protein